MASDTAIASHEMVPVSVEANSQNHDTQVDHLIHDEDGTSQSTSSPAIFDRSELSKSTWQRYGSLESNASTGITSVGSSGSPDDINPSQPVRLNHSHKRSADGSIKARPFSLSRDLSTSSQLPGSHLPSLSGEASSNKRGRPSKTSSSPRSRFDSQVDTASFTARSSIPGTLSASVYANQCVEAALSSRLDPYSCHTGEHRLLKDSLSFTETTVYLNIRNAILRLWLRNPICSVTVEEAAGCAKEPRHFGLAVFAHTWLSRNGYINFGCVEMPQSTESGRAKVKKSLKKPRTIVVVGAGVSGLTTARQLENYFLQHQEEWLDRGETRPRVVILEGRKRIGGRVYSKPLRTQDKRMLPGQYRNTAEMGAMIVTGFDRGNPLDVVIRAQLGLPYHLLKDALTIYDVDGKPVDEKRDLLNTDLYTDISDRTGEFRVQSQRRDTLKGDEELIRRARDPAQLEQSHITEPALDDAFDPLRQRKPISKRGRRTNAPPGNEKITARSEVLEESHASTQAAKAAHEIGWKIKEGVSDDKTVSLRAIADSYEHPSLGLVMDAAIQQYQSILNIKPRDMRLLNWHHANLEYANAAPVSRLSLSGHDQDNGNEFEGAHSEIIGGYTQVPRALLNMPTRLDVRFDHAVQSIRYDRSKTTGASGSVARIVCSNGNVIEADEVVLTAPLGVLKSNTISFDPPLPEWKQGAIERMGFGLLNKLILVYDAPFWDESRDMFGLLNEAEHKDSLDPKHYEARRGRYYLIWNATRISGRYMLIALMAGHAAYQAETTPTTTMLQEITERLKKIFKVQVPAPREIIVTRWRNDKFARGTYSYVAQQTRPEDYDLMATAIGNLHFAGEATCVTHPATVHGAFLSGLRAAADVVDAMTGEIEPPQRPIDHMKALQLQPRRRQTASSPVAKDAVVSPVIKIEPEAAPEVAMTWTAPIHKKASGPPSKSVCSSDPSFWATSSFDDSSDILEATIASIVFAQIGERPAKPARSGINPFLLYTKANWDECKDQCAEEGNTSTGRNLIRQMLGQRWKDLSDADRKPYLDQSKSAQDAAEELRRNWTSIAAKWDADALRIRQDYLRDNAIHHNVYGATSLSGRRRTNVSNSIALDLAKA